MAKRIWVNSNNILVIAENTDITDDKRNPASNVYTEINGTIYAFYKISTDELIETIDFSNVRDENGNVYASQTIFTDLVESSSNISVSVDDGLVVDLATNDLGRDAWGRPKTITDYTLFNALWTYSVPNRVWKQLNNTGTGYVEQTVIDNVLCKSTKGHLSVTGTAGNDVFLQSKRHPRYQPNKGLLYSSAEILPNAVGIGKRRFGLLSYGTGVYFELIGDGANWIMNFVRKTNVIGVITETKVDITAMLPVGFNPEKGHVYDIQAEWRGVGDFFVYVDLQKIYQSEILGTLTELSITNPALHVGFEVLDVGATDLEIIAGCIDVTSEGGQKAVKQYTSVNTDGILLPTTNAGTAMIAVKLPTTVTYDGVPTHYTRDMILTEFTGFCKDESFFSIYFSRYTRTPNLQALTWSTWNDSLYEWKMNDDGALNTAFQLDKANMNVIWSVRQERDFALNHKNPDPDSSDFYLTGGDIVLVEFKSDGTSTGGCTLEFAEEL